MTTKAATPARRASGSLSRLGEVPEIVEPNKNNSDSNNNILSTTTQKNSLSRLPSIKERRTSVLKKARAASFNDDRLTQIPSSLQKFRLVEPVAIRVNKTASHDSTTAQRRESFTSTTSSTATRRASVPQGASPIVPRRSSKPSFVGIGRRVSSMVRARLAFQGRHKSATPEDEESNHMEIIHELPRNPRFSTFLSAEAQYAMMKGYEDMLYEKIARTNPESRPTLKRNKTPYYKKISIVDQEDGAGRKSKGDADSVDDRSESPESKSVTSSSVTSGYGSVSNTPSFSTATSPTSDVSRSLDNRSLSPESTTSSITAQPSPFLKPLRRQSVSVTTHDVNGNPQVTMSAQEARTGFALHRSHSLPVLDSGLSHKKRLVLTYRLESAMDILDTIKRRNKENSLSPRVFRIPRQVDAVRDFNSWTKVWNKEFKAVHVN